MNTYPRATHRLGCLKLLGVLDLKNQACSYRVSLVAIQILYTAYFVYKTYLQRRFEDVFFFTYAEGRKIVTNSRKVLTIKNVKFVNFAISVKIVKSAAPL